MRDGILSWHLEYFNVGGDCFVQKKNFHVFGYKVYGATKIVSYESSERKFMLTANGVEKDNHLQVAKDQFPHGKSMQ